MDEEKEFPVTISINKKYFSALEEIAGLRTEDITPEFVRETINDALDYYLEDMLAAEQGRLSTGPDINIDISLFNIVSGRDAPRRPSAAGGRKHHIRSSHGPRCTGHSNSKP